jgi:hypothetical protein
MSDARSKLTKAGVSVIDSKVNASDVATAVRVLAASGEWEKDGDKWTKEYGDGWQGKIIQEADKFWWYICNNHTTYKDYSYRLQDAKDACDAYLMASQEGEDVRHKIKVNGLIGKVDLPGFGEVKFRVVDCKSLGEKGYDILGTVAWKGNKFVLNAKSYKSGPKYIGLLLNDSKDGALEADEKIMEETGFSVAEVLCMAVDQYIVEHAPEWYKPEEGPSMDLYFEDGYFYEQEQD